MKFVLRAGAAALIAGAVSGCVPIIGAFTLGDLYTGTSLVATGLTGKSLTDDALGMVTGEDCSMMGAVLEKDRKLCEVNGAKVTQADFKGLLGARGTPAQPQTATDAAADTETAANTPPDTEAATNPAVLDAEADTQAVASADAVDTGADTQTDAGQPQPQVTAVVLTSTRTSKTN